MNVGKGSTPTGLRHFGATRTYQSINNLDRLALLLETVTTRWGWVSLDSLPRVAAQRGNPGLNYITALRYKSSTGRLDQSFLKCVGHHRILRSWHAQHLPSTFHKRQDLVEVVDPPGNAPMYVCGV